MRNGVVARVLLVALLVAACSDGGATDDTRPADPTTTSPSTTSAAPGTAVPTTAAPSTSRPPTSGAPDVLPRPVVSLGVGAPSTDRRGGGPLLVVDDQGLALVRADGSAAGLVSGAVRVAFTVDARRVVFQRRDPPAPIELLDVFTRQATVLVSGDADRPVWLEDAAQVDDEPTVLLTRRDAAGRVALSRLAVNGGTEHPMTTFGPGVTRVALTMSTTNVAGVVTIGDAQRAVHLTLDGAAGPAFPEDCATGPCAAWVCVASTDPCRRHVATAPAGLIAGYGIAFIEERQGDQLVTRAELANDGSSGRYEGWVSLPPGTVVRDLRVIDHRYVLVNTWASADRSGAGPAVLVDVFARTTAVLSRAGVASAGAIVDPAPFAAAPAGADEVVSNRDGVWLLRTGAPPRRLLDHPAMVARSGTSTVLAQRQHDTTQPDRQLPLLTVDTVSGAARELFSLDAPSGERGLLLTVAEVDGHPEVFYRRAAPADDRTHPNGTVLLFRRALDGSPERFVASLGHDVGYGTNVLQGIHVVGRTVFGLAPNVENGTNRPVAFDIDGNGVAYFAGVTYCAAEGRCASAPPVCGGGTACVSHFAVSPDGARIAWVLMVRTPVGDMRFDLVVVDVAGGAVLARAQIPNNSLLTLVGGVQWRADDRLIVQSFAPGFGAMSGVTIETTVRGGAIAFAAWPFDGSAHTQQYLIG